MEQEPFIQVLYHLDDLIDRSLLSGKRPISRAVAHARLDLLKYDVIEPCEPDDIVEYISLFLVEKKDESGRLVGDGRTVNAASPRPPRMPIMTIHQFLCKMRTYRFAGQSDGKSFFYQHLLPEDGRKFFGVRIPVYKKRGRILTYRLKRLPMGWSWAPFVAQSVANHLAKAGEADAWVDNFIFGGSSLREAEQRRAALGKSASNYGVEMNPPFEEASIGERIDALGISFDLSSSQFRMDPVWIETKIPLELPTEFTYRSFFQLFGRLVWAGHVRMWPLWERAESLAALSTAATQVQASGTTDKWDAPYFVPDYAVEDLRRWMAEVRQNDWQELPSEERCHLLSYSDASDTDKAHILVDKLTVLLGQQGPRSDEQHIFFGELYAFIDAIQHYDGEHIDREVLHLIDNMTLHLVLKKGHSSNIEANRALRAALGKRRPQSAWVPTEENLSDAFTRGVDLPVLPIPLDQLPVTTWMDAQGVGACEVKQKHRQNHLQGKQNERPKEREDTSISN